MAWYYSYENEKHFESDKSVSELLEDGVYNHALADHNPHGGISAILNEIQKLQARIAVLEKQLADQ